MSAAGFGAGRRMVFVGPLAHGTTTLQRLETMRELGFDVATVDTRPEWLARKMLGLGWRIRRRLLGYVDEAGANVQMLSLPAAPAPDLIWIEKGVAIEPETLRILKWRWRDAVFVSFSPDDMFNPLNQSPQWLEAMELYDVHVTTKSHNVPELRSAGARRVAFMDKGFSPKVHRPIAVTSADIERLGGDVGFIGWPERARSRSMMALARAGIPVRIWGPWLRWWPRHPKLRVEGRPLWGDDYAHAICSFRINLCFLRKANRDQQTTRSMEIPACGAFMLAERTAEHLEMFEEGREAAFFSSDDELVERVRYYLENEDERRQIAAGGLRRCIEGRYSYFDRLRQVLQPLLDSRAEMPALRHAIGGVS